MQQNPYTTQPGFGLRLFRAKSALERYGRNYDHPPYSRSFDNCFENFDGDAVVWALMNEATKYPSGYLAEGIRRTGEAVWSHWMEVFEQRGKYAPKVDMAQLNLPLGPQRPRPPTP